MTATSRDSRSARQITRKALPIEKANEHNGNKDANNDFLTTDLSPSDYPSAFRISVMLPSAGKLVAKLKKSTTTLNLYFNTNANLTAGALYEFHLLMHEGDTVNFQSDQNQNGFYLRVQEVAWAVH